MFGESERRATHQGEPVAYGTLHQRMVEMYAPPSVLVSPDQKVVHLSEHAARYLTHPGGEPTANVFKIVRQELRTELRACLQTAREKRSGVDSKTSFYGDRWHSPVDRHACRSGFGA
jgi:two-component system CheB/CheR fusion protein